MRIIPIHEVHEAIASLPGKTVKPWRDGDARCHCSHCDLCGDCYPTNVLHDHEQECCAAVLKALRVTLEEPLNKNVDWAGNPLPGDGTIA